MGVIRWLPERVLCRPTQRAVRRDALRRPPLHTTISILRDVARGLSR